MQTKGKPGLSSVNFLKQKAFTFSMKACVIFLVADHGNVFVLKRIVCFKDLKRLLGSNLVHYSSDALFRLLKWRAHSLLGWFPIMKREALISCPIQSQSSFHPGAFNAEPTVSNPAHCCQYATSFTELSSLQT